jgi:DNA-binding NtrC family response regulator
MVMAGEEIWIIDDNTQVTDCIKQYGNMIGYSVRTFELADEALEEIVNFRAKPEVVVCDLNGKKEGMKQIGMDGNQFFLEAFPYLRNSLKYLLTAAHEIPHIVDSMHVPVINKPITPKAFYKRIAHDLGDLVGAEAENCQ